MSSITNCHNHPTSAPLSESDNDDENQVDSSHNRQNESMMHKVKDVVSKLLHPSFLFSSNDDTNRPKRKRSTSVEEHDDAQQIATITTNTTNGHTTRSKSTYDRSTIRDDEPQITDDEDSNSRDATSTEQDLTEIEQQKKRRRTANYQHILSTKTTNGHHDVERTSSPFTSIDSIRSLSNIRIQHTTTTTPVLHQTSIEQNHNERINRSKQRFNILPTYRTPTSNYDPSKSPLFSPGRRKPTETTTTNLKSNEFSANYLLASSLATRPQPSPLNTQQSPATLTHPITINNSNRLLSNERQMFGVNYASINSRRLPYIERLRRRTLEDCIRLNRTTDSEPLSVSIIEEHKSTTASPAPKRTKLPEKECGIQCDISTVESSIEQNKKIQRTFPPPGSQNEALSVPITEKIQSSSQTESSIQTNSSITIEKIQPPVPTIGITKPKVLGDVTPFSWPKFARAQEEYAKKYPEKCRADAVVPSVSERPTVNITPIVPLQTNTSISTIPKMPIFPFSPSRPTESIWKCPACTKEHPAQTASCSLCHCINPNYKKPSAVEPTNTIEKQPMSSNKLPDVIAKEPTIPIPSTTITNQIIPTTTKENILSIPPPVTTSATFPLLNTTPITSVPVTTKESSTTITAPITTSSATAPLFGTVPIVLPITTTQENSVSISTAPPVFGITRVVSPTITTTTKESSVTTSTPSLFGTATTKEGPVTNSTPPLFGSATTKESPVTTSTPPLFGTTTFDKTLTTSANAPFQIGTAFQPFTPVSSPSLTTAVTSSTVASTATIMPSIPTSVSSLQPSTSIPFGPFSSSPITTTTATATPVVSTVSSIQSPAFTFAPNTSAPSLTTTTATTSNLFGSSTITPAPAPTATTISFPASSTTTSAFTIPSNFAFTSTATTSAPLLFGSGGLNLPLTSTTTSSNPQFGFGADSPPRPFAPAVVSPMNSTPAPAFGTTASFGTTAPFGTTTPFGTIAPFGITPASVDKPASSVSSSISFGTSNTPPSFGFGSGSNTIQPSTAPVVSAGSFSFVPSSSTIPVFGAGPPSLSSTFSATPAPPINNNLFQFSGATPATNIFSTPISSDSSAEPPNPFSIDASSSSSTTTTQRLMLKARRHRP